MCRTFSLSLIHDKERPKHLVILYSSAFEQFGKGSSVVSRIIASSVQPPVVKLENPVVVDFFGIQVISSCDTRIFVIKLSNEDLKKKSVDQCEFTSLYMHIKLTLS